MKIDVLEELDFMTLVSTPAPPISWVIDGVAARGHLAALVGREKTGKSLLALTLAAQVAKGGGDVGGVGCLGGRVVLLDAENGLNELHRRVRRTGMTVAQVGRFEPVLTRGFDLLREEHHVQLGELLERTTPDLLVIDSFRTMWSGDEVDAGQVAEALDPLRRMLQDTGIAGLLLHHGRKAAGQGADAYRGGTGIGASVEHIVVLERVANDTERARRRLSNPSTRIAAEMPDHWLAIEAGDDAVTFEEAHEFKGGRAPVRAELAEELVNVALRYAARGSEEAHTGMTLTALAEAVGRKRDDRTVREALAMLAEDGLMLRTEKGPWRATLEAELIYGRNGKGVNT
jgi:KaiC/GvpD/RAD55 family RecA-like ATPase